MPVVMQSQGDGPTIQYRRIHLTGLYLQSARKAAVASLAISTTTENLDERVELGILVVMWSVLALEAGANQFAEDVFAKYNLNDFDHCKKEFQKPARISKTIWKWLKLFAEGPKTMINLSDSLFVDAERVIQLRHRLSHYRPQDTSQKVYYQPTAPIKQPDGRFYREMWNADMKPTKVEPSLVESELVANKSRENFIAVRNMFARWELAYGRDVSEFNKTIPSI